MCLASLTQRACRRGSRTEARLSCAARAPRCSTRRCVRKLLWPSCDSAFYLLATIRQAHECSVFMQFRTNELKQRTRPWQSADLANHRVQVVRLASSPIFGSQIRSCCLRTESSPVRAAVAPTSRSCSSSFRPARGLHSTSADGPICTDFHARTDGLQEDPRGESAVCAVRFRIRAVSGLHRSRRAQSPAFLLVADASEESQPAADGGHNPWRSLLQSSRWLSFGFEKDRCEVGKGKEKD
jgi:hypothetical protein